MARVNKGAIRRILAADPTWSAYALADLQPAMAPYCAWYVAADGEGLALIYSGLSIPTLFTFGPVTSVADAVAQLTPPARIYVTVREEHLPIVGRYYDLRHDTRPMLRMMLPAAVKVDQPPATARRLTGANGEQLRELYSHGGAFAPDAFEPSQVDSGAFFGILDDADCLLAAGGTHIVDWTNGVAAIGNMYTRPDCRGRGYAGMLLQAIVHTLRDGGVTNIVLNVDQRNRGARQLYKRYGFVPHCPYVEGIGELME